MKNRFFMNIYTPQIGFRIWSRIAGLLLYTDNIHFWNSKNQFIVGISIFLTILLSTVNSQILTSKLDLMPYPKEVKLNNGKFRLTSEFILSVIGNGNERIYPAATRMLRRLDRRTGLFFKQNFIKSNITPDTVQMMVYCERSGEVKLGEDESYKLIITESRIEINAVTDLGAMHGMETLLQLLKSDKEGYYFPSIEINDEPRFPWRGLLIDVCRHFMPIDVLKRNLDGMAAVKMNVFHWHLSEDQGFRVESKTYPKLHELGSDGFYYTHEEIKDIIQYAEDRGIRVIPEFDVPGHATSWFVGYPELASNPGPYTIERNWGIMDPTFNPTIEETYEFLDNFFGEMSTLFSDEYFHIGGDENNGKQWDANELIQNFMRENSIKDNHELQAYFNNRILKILTKHGKKMIGWDEILVPGIPKSIVIQSWRGQEALVKSAQKGYKGILSNGYYIDLNQHTDYHYLNDPIPLSSPLSDSAKKNILGGEATMWSEFVTPENIDSRIWPRTAAIAERLWSQQNINDVDNMYKRLDKISFLLEDLNLTHIKNYGMMLRRLANNNAIDPLKNLIDIIEPVKIYQRHDQGVQYFQKSPYTRVVDAARPESKRAREFNKIVFDYVDTKNTQELDTLKFWLTKWKNNHSKLIPLMEISPIIREINTLSINLSNLSEVGLEALVMINNNESASVEWLDKASLFIEKAKKPYGQTEIHIIEGVERLVGVVKNN